mgnify:CR=1 FL=1
MARTVEAHDYGERWDVSDERALLNYRAKGWTCAAIGDRMGRTATAVRSKLYRLRRG